MAMPPARKVRMRWEAGVGAVVFTP
jgi:hypothetical protein